MLFPAGEKASSQIQGEESRHACGVSAKRHGSSCLPKSKLCEGISRAASMEVGVDALSCFSMNGSIKHLPNRLQGRKGCSKGVKRGRRRRVKNAADLLCQEEHREGTPSSMTQCLAGRLAHGTKGCISQPPGERAICSVSVLLLERVGRASPIILIPSFCKLCYLYVPKMLLTRPSSSGAGRRS